jgi:hypothetical protein
MLCPKCNQPVADGARFCGSCGESISAGDNPEATIVRPPRGPVGAAGATSGGGAPPGGGAGPSAGGGYSTGGAAPGGGSPGWAAGLGAAAPGLIDRIKNIILTPKTEWPVIEAESTTIPQLYKGYVIYLAAFSALMSFVRMSVIGISFFRVPLLSGLTFALVNFIFGLLGLYVIGWVIDMLAPTFAGQRDRRQAVKTAAYVFTPGALGSVFGLLGLGLGTLLQLAAAIYGIYLLYLGLPVLMRSPREKAAGYTAAVIVCVILLFIVFGIIMSVVNPMRRYNPFGMNGTAMTREERQVQAAGQVGAMLAAAAQKMQAQQAAANAAAGASSTAAPAASDAPAAATNTQNGAAATAGMLAALGGAMAGSRRADPVDFHTLKALLPDSLPGMQRTNAEAGTQGALGMKASSATGDYQGQGGTRTQIKIVDASAVSGLLNVAGSMAASNTSESDTGFEKDTMIGGRNVHEKYDNRSKHGELIAIVANRFSVSVTGDGVDVGTLEQYAALVDFSKLDAMKDAGVHAQQ